jgi:signal transduction histidine kinase
MFRVASALRVVVLVSVLLGLAFLPDAAPPSRSRLAIYLLIGTDFLLTFAYYAWGKRHRSSIRSLTLGILLSEVIIVSIGLRLIQLEYAVYGLPIYLFLVIAGAALHSSFGAFLIAALSASAFGITAFYDNHSRYAVVQRPISNHSPEPGTTAVVNSITCLTFAVVASALSQAMRDALLRARSLEEELRAANRMLGSRIKEAVDAIRLTNEELATKNDTLAATLRSVERFAKAISHDLRNPITAAGESIRLSLARDGAGREKLLTLASENLLRADRMLVGLRDLMRAVGSTSEAEEIDLESLVLELTDELSALLGGVRVPVRVRGELGTVVGRTVELAVVYRNLLANAVMHNREVASLTIEVGRNETDQGSVFYVRDNGVGISADFHARIFEPFHQGATRKDGLGLGLALVDAVVTHVGGRIWVVSSIGTGATFYFTYPHG